MTEILEIGSIKIKTSDKVYIPEEDSFLLMKNLVDVNNKTVLDIGCGTGIQSINALKKGAKLVVGIDINPLAVKLSLKNARLNNCDLKRIFFFESDLFSRMPDILNELSEKGYNIKDFDVILFNAPYLPTSEDEKLNDVLNYSFDGGFDGRKVLDKFIKEVGKYLSNDGIVQIVQSSLTDEGKTYKMLDKYGFKGKKVDSIKFFYEEIQIINFVRKNNPL